MSESGKTPRDVFLAAIQLPGEARTPFVEKICGADGDLRQRVAALIAAHDAVATNEPPPRSGVPTLLTETHLPESEFLGTMIGPYKLREVLGEGGMGIVYVAEQEKPIRRKVALKVVKPGMDSKEVVARFEAERQALALMDHPNIAKVIDAGTTEAGRPYFVMELVRGLSITDYCDERRLSPRERLKLFITVCQAVQHAHQRGIIHRDLKPSNVMITLHDGVPVPKVIDFGVAKAINQRLTEHTLYTRNAQMVGTPLYMSPEQAELSGLEVDTRSDVYSLGVLLYELLTGTTPFDKETFSKVGYDEMRRMIREEETARPSHRISTLTVEARSTISSRRGVDERHLPRALRGELDWIVMKALEKDRTRRYGSSDSLSADVQRYLDDQPIEACSPSMVYLMRTFARRNRVAVSITALVVLMFVLSGLFGLLNYVGELRRADLARKLRRADEQREREHWARDIAFPRIQRHIVEKHPVAAFRLGKQVQEILPDNSQFLTIWEQLTEAATLRIEPAGTRVFIRDWDAPVDDWLEIGQSPLLKVRLPKGAVRWKLVKNGYVTLEMQRHFPQLATQEFSLVASCDSPDEMILIPGAKAHTKTTGTLQVDVGRFFIDRFEVTNREYQRFVDDGGYANSRYWKHQFVQHGDAISHAQAMEVFRDKTGKPGPATWLDGHFPVGEDEFPVRGVSWYEAAAFSDFCGKELPTRHHWRQAAYGNVAQILPLSNFSGRGPAPVATHPGIGWFGVYDVAGNVTEWCSTQGESDKRLLRGGSWNDPSYMFTDENADAPMSRSITYGFRCVRYLDEPSAEALAPYRPHLRKYDEEPAATAEDIAAHLTHFAYDNSMPLNAESRLIDCEAAADYRHDVIRIDATYREERFDIHLFFPRDKRPPYEMIVWFPTASAFRGGAFVSSQRDIQDLMRTGRALCAPIYQGTYERQTAETEEASVRERAFIIQIAQDLSRTVDYLKTRADIDFERLIYAGKSRGAWLAPILLVVEPRLRAAILIDGGYQRTHHFLPQVEPRNYTPYVKVPVLLMNGMNDESFPVVSSQLSMYRHLGSSDKSLKHFNSGHGVPMDEAMMVADEWLRSRIGSTSVVESVSPPDGKARLNEVAPIRESEFTIGR